MDCPDGKIYHCAKIYDSPEVKDYEEDVIESFTEGCALAKYCSEGKEPALSFVENQKILKDPLVYCIICKNANRYNSRPEWSSNYSECSYKKQNICSTKKHKIACKSSGSTSERLCRCDARGGYKPVGSVQGKTCSTENWKCMSSDCPGDQFFNYTCAPRCPVGTKRSEDSDDCQHVLTRKTDSNQATTKHRTTTKQAPENNNDPTSPPTTYSDSTSPKVLIIRVEHEPIAVILLAVVTVVFILAVFIVVLVKLLFKAGVQEIGGAHNGEYYDVANRDEAVDEKAVLKVEYDAKNQAAYAGDKPLEEDKEE